MNRRAFLRASVAAAVATAAAPIERLAPAAIPAASGLTIAKILRARELLDAAECQGPFMLYCTERQLDQLLSTTETAA